MTLSHTRPFRRPRIVATGLRIWVVAGAALLLAACGEDVRVVRYDPFLSHLPGAEGGQPPIGERPGTPEDPMAVPEDQLVVTNPDGSVTLIAKVVRHLIGHLARVMEADDQKLLYDQIISEQTKAHFAAEGQDPRKAVAEFFRDNRADIDKLIARMPAGERTPGVILSKTGPKQFKLTVTGTAAKGLRFNELWVVMEKGNWRLWWFA
ncbi:MAG: hypothetical protein ACKVOT_13600 [Polaromonas sp.]